MLLVELLIPLELRGRTLPLQQGRSLALAPQVLEGSVKRIRQRLVYLILVMALGVVELLGGQLRGEIDPRILFGLFHFVFSHNINTGLLYKFKL